MSEHEQSQEPEQQEERVEDLEPSEEQADEIRGGAVPPNERPRQ